MEMYVRSVRYFSSTLRPLSIPKTGRLFQSVNNVLHKSIRPLHISFGIHCRHAETNNGLGGGKLSTEQLSTMCNQGQFPLLTLHECKFPSQKFPLELSESRYKVMMASVMGTELPSELNELQEGLFGLVCKHPQDMLEKSIGETDWRSFNIGTIVKVDNLIQMDHEDVQLTCTALHLARFDHPERSLLGYWVANATPLSIDATNVEEHAIEAAKEAKQTYSQFLAMDNNLTDEEKKTVLDTMESLGMDCVKLSDWLAARLPISAHAKQLLLESTDPLFRLLTIKVQFAKIIAMYNSIEGGTDESA